MYSELEKWIVIRKMVEEKYLELKRAVEALSFNYSSFNMVIQTSKSKMVDYYKSICALIKSHFISPKNTKTFTNGWISNLSAVDLLHLYNYLNNILRCFYHYVDIAVYDCKKNKEVLVDYRMRRCGDTAGNADDIFSRFIKNVKNFGKPNPNRLDEECYEIDKYFVKSDVEFTGKPNDDENPSVDLYNLDYRKAVVALLIEDSVKRYNRNSAKNKKSPNQTLKKDKEKKSTKIDFESARKEFCLSSRSENGFGIKDLPAPYSDEFYFRYNEDVSSRFVGVDEWGNPITMDAKSNYFNSFGEQLPDDVYFVPTNNLE